MAKDYTPINWDQRVAGWAQGAIGQAEARARREAEAVRHRELARGGEAFAVAWDRDEPAPCERNTPGCCVWHAVEDAAAGGHDGCECW